MNDQEFDELYEKETAEIKKINRDYLIDARMKVMRGETLPQEQLSAIISHASYLNTLERDMLKFREAIDAGFKDILVQEMYFNPGKFEGVLRHPVFFVFAVEMAETFYESGAENYLELGLHAGTKGNFLLTIQKQDKKTPAELRNEAEQEVIRLREELEKADGLLLEMVMQHCSENGIIHDSCMQPHESVIAYLYAKKYLVTAGREKYELSSLVNKDQTEER